VFKLLFFVAVAVYKAIYKAIYKAFCFGNCQLCTPLCGIQRKTSYKTAVVICIAEVNIAGCSNRERIRPAYLSNFKLVYLAELNCKGTSSFPHSLQWARAKTGLKQVGKNTLINLFRMYITGLLVGRTHTLMQINCFCILSIPPPKWQLQIQTALNQVRWK